MSVLGVLLEACSRRALGGLFYISVLGVLLEACSTCLF